MAENNIQPVYSQDDFLNGTTPFEEVYRFKDDRFAHARELEKMSKIAKIAKVNNFKKLYSDYYHSQMDLGGYIENSTNFPDQSIELNAGTWTANEDGVSRFSEKGEQVACVHPITISRRLVNVDTDFEKIEIAFRKGKMKSWKKIIVDKKIIASANQIVALSEYGIAVTSENAKYLVQYLHDIENDNYDDIPENNSVTRLGWIGGNKFSPYVEDLIFDGEGMFKHLYDSIHQKGKRQKWIDEAIQARNKSLYNKIVLASSFASVLVEPCNALPFFVHLNGGTGNGKTVSIMLGASVWANPNVGAYTITFNSTPVGHELYAGFVNSLPLIMDELQIIKDKKDFDQLIYMLAEGSGKTRGSKTGGIRQSTRWRNCMITTGETPITHDMSAGGALNRIIDLDCREEQLFEQGNKSAKIIQNNYGFAGKEFIDWLSETDNMNRVLETQGKYYEQLIKDDKTGKQALSASLILATDEIISELFFDDDAITIDEIKPILLSNDDVSQNKRADVWLQDWIAENSNKFSKHATEMYGEIESLPGEKHIYIIGSVFNKACLEQRFDPKSFWSYLKEQDKVISDGKGNKVLHRINGIPTRCVCVKMMVEGENIEKEPPY